MTAVALTQDTFESTIEQAKEFAETIQRAGKTLLSHTTRFLTLLEYQGQSGAIPPDAHMTINQEWVQRQVDGLEHGLCARRARFAGPGDPLANPEKTFKTFELIARTAPDIKLCLSTNGLALPDHVDTIAGFSASAVS